MHPTLNPASVAASGVEPSGVQRPPSQRPVLATETVQIAGPAAPASTPAASSVQPPAVQPEGPERQVWCSRNSGTTYHTTDQCRYARQQRQFSKRPEAGPIVMTLKQAVAEGRRCCADCRKLEIGKQ